MTAARDAPGRHGAVCATGCFRRLQTPFTFSMMCAVCSPLCLLCCCVPLCVTFMSQVNKLTSTHTIVTHGYYTLPFCMVRSPPPLSSAFSEELLL